MAISEFFREIGQRYLIEASRLHGHNAASLYQQAAQLCLDGKTEEATLIASRAKMEVGRSQELRDNNRKLNEGLVPTFIRQLKDLGVDQEPGLDFLACFDNSKRSRVQLPGERNPVDTSNQNPNLQSLDVKKPPLPESDPKKREKRQIALTSIQARIAQARLRLIETDNETITVREAVETVFKNEIAAQVALGISHDIATRDQIALLSSCWPPVHEKLTKAFELLGGVEARLPFTEEQLNRLAYAPITQQLCARLNEVLAYQGMTLQELIIYTRRQPIDVRKKNPSLENKPDIDVPEPIPAPELTFSEHEAYFGAEAIVKGQKIFLPDLQTRYFLTKCVNDLRPCVPDDDSLVQTLWQKYQQYQQLTPEQRVALRKREGEGSMINQMLLEFEKKPDCDIQRALGIRVGKNGNS